MIIEYIRYRIESQRADEFLAAYGTASASLRDSPVCLDYELARCTEDPQRFVLRIHWTSVEDHLEVFRKSSEFRTFLSSIRPYVDDIEEMLHYEKTRVVSPVTIYDAVGGAETFFRFAKRAHETMREDKTLGPLFRHAAESHVPHLAMWLCEVFGGPTLYSDVHSTISPMLSRHAQLNISGAQQLAFLSCVRQVVAEVVAPEQERARDAIMAYFEWGVRVAADNSRPKHVPDPLAGVPKWDWDSRT